MLKLIQKIGRLIAKPFLGTELPNGQKLYRIPRDPQTWVLTAMVLTISPLPFVMLAIVIEAKCIDTFFGTLIVLEFACLCCGLWQVKKLWKNKAALAQAIPADHGETFFTVIKNLRSEPYEYYALFSLTGEKLLETTTLCAFSVQMNAPEQEKFYPQFQELIVLHNHPDSDYSFSPEDIYLAIKRRPKMSFIVTDNHLECLIPTVRTPTYTTDEALMPLWCEIRDLYEASIHTYQPCFTEKRRCMALRAACQELADHYHLVYLSITLNPPA